MEKTRPADCDEDNCPGQWAMIKHGRVLEGCEVHGWSTDPDDHAPLDRPPGGAARGLP